MLLIHFIFQKEVRIVVEEGSYVFSYPQKNEILFSLSSGTLYVTPFIRTSVAARRHKRSENMKQGFHVVWRNHLGSGRLATHP